MHENIVKNLVKTFINHWRFFDRQGNAISFDDWTLLVQKPGYMIVRHEEVGEYCVSTIWTGINISFLKEPSIKIFETMIFAKDDQKQEKDPIDDYLDRYSTEEEALLGHEMAVKICKGEIPVNELVE